MPPFLFIKALVYSIYNHSFILYLFIQNILYLFIENILYLFIENILYLFIEK